MNPGNELVGSPDSSSTFFKLWRGPLALRDLF